MKEKVKLFWIIALVTVLGFVFAACVDSNGGGTHTHVYSSTWSSNETQHWKECTGTECDSKIEIVNHAPTGGVCTTCKYDNTPAHTHVYSSTLSSNGTQHWKECTGTGCDSKIEISNHSGHNCICSYITHLYSSIWSSSVTQHWKECTITGCDAKSGIANHAPSNGKCTTCGYDNSLPTVYSIGDKGPGGGIIFYYNQSGFTVTGTSSFTAHYLEAAPVNQGTSLTWASSGFTTTNITGTRTAIGTGKENTAAILAVDVNAPAAKACRDYTGGGKNDWFLPSKDELNEMYKIRITLGILSSTLFWSSSQYSGDISWSQAFDNFGNQFSGIKKPASCSVRAIRAF